MNNRYNEIIIVNFEVSLRIVRCHLIKLRVQQLLNNAGKHTICEEHLNRQPVQNMIKLRAFHILVQIYTAHHATFSIQKDKITVQICGNF